MNPKEEVIATEMNKQYKGLRASHLMIIGMLVPTLIALMAWLIENSRGVGTGTGLAYQLLFNPGDIFTDWLIPNAWAHELNPWKYFASKYEGLLPPSLYGPTIFIALRLLPGAGELSRNQIILHIIFTFLLVAISGIMIIMSNKSIGKIGADGILLQILFISCSYPVVFCMQRGNTAIISYFLLSASVFLIIAKYESGMWAIPLSLYSLSSIQLMPLLPLIMLTSLQHKRAIIYTLACATGTLVYVINTGVTISDVGMTLKEASRIITGMGYIYNHDLYSASFQLWHGQAGIAHFIYNLAIIIAAMMTVRIAYSLLLLKRSDSQGKLIDASSSDAKYRLLACILWWNVMTLIFSIPSADYHLLRILPFLTLATNPKLDGLLSSTHFKMDRYKKALIFLSAGYLLSYSKLWGFLGVTDLSVTIRCACLVVLLIEILSLSSKTFKISA